MGDVKGPAVFKNFDQKKINSRGPLEDEALEREV